MWLTRQDYGQEARLRYAAWLVVQALPTEGLKDALRSLASVVERHQEHLTLGGVERAFRLPGRDASQADVDIHPEPMDQETARMILDF